MNSAIVVFGWPKSKLSAMQPFPVDNQWSALSELLIKNYIAVR